MAEIQCTKCGVFQDPERPTCSHLIRSKGGRTTAAKGSAHYRRLGRLGAAASIAKPGELERRAAAAKAGGAALRAKVEADPEYFKKLGARGGAVIKARAERAKSEALLGLAEEVAATRDGSAVALLHTVAETLNKLAEEIGAKEDGES